MSRANSPPPSKVGSAPVRTITKSQQRKERQARARLAEGVIKSEEPVTKAEEVQAPIVGRKKKAKREKTQGTAESTPTATRPASPLFREDVREDNPELIAAPVTPVRDSKKSATKAPIEIKEPDTPSSPATPTTGDMQKAALTAASIFAHLQKAGDISASAAELFRILPGLSHRVESLEPIYSDTDGSSVSDDQIRLLEHGEAIRVERGPNDYAVMLPDRQALHGFTADQASRYLHLRKQALANGDVPSHQALKGLTSAHQPLNTALAVSTAKRASKSKKLVNQFAPPAALTSGGAMPPSMQKYVGAGVSDEASLDKSAIKTVAEAETAMGISRKDTEVLEKKLIAILKKNRRLLFGNAH